MEPKKGKHKVYCFMCGKVCGEVLHRGGERKLKKCKYCQGLAHYCFDCFEK